MLEAINKEIRLANTLLLPDYKEMKHLLGYYREDPDSIVFEKMERSMNKVLEVCKPCALYSVFPIKEEEDGLNLGFAKVVSQDLSRNLKDCHHVIVVGLTIGSEVDRLIQRASRLNPSEGYLLQAAGAACAERFANDVNDLLKEEYKDYVLKPRYSCGYGDFDLKHQRDIFKAMPKFSSIGLTLMDTGIMAPSKSITALIGISDVEGECYLPECDKCDECGRKL